MEIVVREHSAGDLAGYAEVSIAFTVSRVLAVIVREQGLAGLELAERVLETPYVKDYDRIERPVNWPRRFDLSNWGFFGAWTNGRRVGSAAIAFRCPDVDMLEDAEDVAALWDIRVATSARRLGVGSALFDAAVRWAAVRGCRRLKVETQNINVPACRFYAGQGCELAAIDRFAYPLLPDEVQLVWQKDLRSDD